MFFLLSDASDHQCSIVPRRLSSDTAGQALLISLLVGPLDVCKFLSVPVEADNSRNEEMVFGAQSRHGIFQELRGVHILVNSMEQLGQEGVLHMTRKFLLDTISPCL